MAKPLWSKLITKNHMQELEVKENQTLAFLEGFNKLQQKGFEISKIPGKIFIDH